MTSKRLPIASPGFQRPVSPELDKILGTEYPILDHGSLTPVDYMGNDDAVCEAARNSYGKGTSRKSNNMGLINYLMQKRHCYRGDMQVLTIEGWKYWNQCSNYETFMVPDPVTRTLTTEYLPLETFNCDEDLCIYENERMSYAVTPDHRMWFKGKYQKEFGIITAEEKSHWGHFDPFVGYSYVNPEGEKDHAMQLIGFYLGDGSYASKNRLSFNLKKERKIKYLKDILIALDIPWKERQKESLTITISIPEFMKGEIDVTKRAKDKNFIPSIGSLYDTEIRGLWDGLVNSDGSVKKDRKQIEFSSLSGDLIDLFTSLSAMMGMDAHSAGDNVTAYLPDGRTSLESRKQYHSKEVFSGKVYCTTTSTGLLVVRGGPDKFGFICGNTSPFEMPALRYHMVHPIFVARQWVRHRTASLNEYSGRYSIMNGNFYIPNLEQIMKQSTSNNQGREGAFPERIAQDMQNALRARCEEAWQSYEDFVHGFSWFREDGTAYEESDFMDAQGNVTIDPRVVHQGEHGMSRELARGVLPVFFYTEWTWTQNLHNTLHLLHLRDDPHAQWECRQYAIQLDDIVRQWTPLCHSAFEQYLKMSTTFSGKETKMLKELIATEQGMIMFDAYRSLDVESVKKDNVVSKREWDDFLGKIEAIIED